MSMPCSETALDEFTCRALYELLDEGDDLYIGWISLASCLVVRGKFY